MDHPHAAPAETLRTSRFVIGVVALCLLGLIGLSALGVPAPHLAGGSNQPAVTGVRAASISVVAQPPAGAVVADWAYLAVEPGGSLLVTDRARHQVLRIGAGGQVLAQWGPTFGSQQLGEPAGVAEGPAGIYVVDRTPPRVLHLNTAGQLQGVLSLDPYGTYGVNDVKVDPTTGNLYVADTGRNRILVLAPDGSLLHQFGTGGTGLGNFKQPYALTFGPDNGIYVADWENARIERWDATTLTATAVWSTGFRPFGVAVDNLGRVYAPDADRARVSVFAPGGQLLADLGGQGSPSISLQGPSQLAFGPDPRGLYVLGHNGLALATLQDTAPQADTSTSGSGGALDALLPLVGGLLIVVLAGAGYLALTRRRQPVAAVRESAVVGVVLGVGPSAGPVRVHPEDGAEGEYHEGDADEEGRVGLETAEEHDAGQQDEQAEPDAGSH